MSISARTRQSTWSTDAPEASAARKAALDLTTTTTPVDVVAHYAGDKSRSSFVRAFRKAYNVDPSEYRQSVKNGEDDKGA